MQYTLRDVPPTVDSELRRRARREGKSLNAVAIEALTRGAGLGETPVRARDLADVASTWQEDEDFDRAVADQDRIDEAMWR
jgi:plasmid stability protein